MSTPATGDRPAAAEFAAFVVEHSASLHRAAYLMTGDRDRAQDAVQTALTRIYLAWSRRDSWENPGAYAHQVVTRVVLSSSRRRWWGERPTGDVMERVVAAPRSDLESVEDRDLLRRALQALPVKQRSAVVLRFYLDLSEADAAQAMRCPVGTVKSLTARGLASLRTLLKSASR